MKCNSAHKRQKEAGSSVFHFPSQNGTGWESGRYSSARENCPPAKEPEWKTATYYGLMNQGRRERRAKSGKGLTQGEEKCLKNDILHAKLLHNKKHIVSAFN